MALNTGRYTSAAKLLTEMANAGLSSALNVILSNKTVVSGTETEYDFAPLTPAPAVGDFLVQGNALSMITAVPGGNKVRVADGTAILTGKAKVIPFEGTESDLNEMIDEAMAFVDLHTRQWFNARTFDDSNPVLWEGNNSSVIFLQVPIIEITAIRKQLGGEILDPTFYQVFNGRAMPDDRRNPMIKLRQEDDDVLFVSSGKFMRGVRAVITGVFGFVEPDGSTPKPIQRATLKLATMYAAKSIGESAQSAAEEGDLGPIKREKTDMHEIEYFDARDDAGGASGEGGQPTADTEINKILANYRGPMVIGGTFPDIGVEAPVLASWTRDGEG